MNPELRQLPSIEAGIVSLQCGSTLSREVEKCCYLEEIAVGDIVLLRSGGPPMTVARKTEAGEVACQWFDVYGVVHYEMFKPIMLRWGHREAALRRRRQDSASGRRPPRRRPLLRRPQLRQPHRRQPHRRQAPNRRLTHPQVARRGRRAGASMTPREALEALIATFEAARQSHVEQNVRYHREDTAARADQMAWVVDQTRAALAMPEFGEHQPHNRKAEQLTLEEIET